MNIFYAQDPYDEGEYASIFLAGPTPRSVDVPSWRPEAVGLFKKHGFDGSLYIPERDDWGSLEGYGSQIEWEHHHLAMSKAILMWVPRDLMTMPAFTTNIEFGLYLSSAEIDWSTADFEKDFGIERPKLFYGRPDEAPKNGYMDYCYKKFLKRDPCKTLEELVKQAIAFTKTF